MFYDGFPDKIIVAQIWPSPEMFNQHRYRMGWWLLGGPLLFARSVPQANHTMVTCQPRADRINQN